MGREKPGLQEPRSGWTYDLERELLKHALARRRLTQPQRRNLTWRGLAGALATLMNVPTRRLGERLGRSYEEDGWPGVVAFLAVEEVLGDSGRRAMLDATMFMAMRWKVSTCTHPIPHGFPVPHRFIRHPRGPEPKACPIRAAAARKYRLRHKHVHEARQRRRERG